MMTKATCLLFALIGAAVYSQNHAEVKNEGGVDYTTPATCKQYYLNDPQKYEPGFYYLQPSVGPKFKVYCAVYGYTLLMKVNGSESTFKYSSELWTNSQTFQPSRFDLDYNETKLQSFSTVDFTELYLRVVTASVTREIIIPVQSTSLLNLLKDGNYTAVDLGRDPWLNLVPGSFLQDYCNMAGFNVNTPRLKQVRIGIVANNEDSCTTADSWVGVGGGNVENVSCGSSDTYQMDIVVHSFAYVFAR
ncbi:uncharacterized protein [Oscarella lobularis]|uniref:uncharacterized protein n=1 Tax=Oscarella lobularis TaxID=121494 RepID=UPI003313694A